MQLRISPGGRISRSRRRPAGASAVIADRDDRGNVGLVKAVPEAPHGRPVHSASGRTERWIGPSRRQLTRSAIPALCDRAGSNVTDLARLGIPSPTISRRASETKRRTGAIGGDEEAGLFLCDGLLLRRKPELNPNPPPQTLDRSQGNEGNRRHRAGKGIRFARADNLA